MIDLTTLAAAKAYTDKKVAKVIDLRNYADGDSSINALIIACFARGGGVAIVDNATTSFIPSFLADISTDKKIKFVLDASAISEGFTIECEPNSVSKVGDTIVCIETSFLVLTTGAQRVTVLFNFLGNSTRFVVTVEQITVPE